MIYIFRFFIPYPLSAFYPYPWPHLGIPVLISPLFIISLIVLIWYHRKNSFVIFGSLFFLINLLLVLQLVAIGTTVISERYTYVPYIGLGFLFSMALGKLRIQSPKTILLMVSISLILCFGFLTYKRTIVWKDGGTLWDDAIAKYP